MKYVFLFDAPNCGWLREMKDVIKAALGWMNETKTGLRILWTPRR